MARHADKQPRPLDPATRERVAAYQYLAEALAWREHRRCGRTVPLEELLGEASLGLVYAASLYDQAREVPFGAYVTLVIRHRLAQAVTVWRRGGRLDHVRFTDLAAHGPKGKSPSFEPDCPRTREAGEQAAQRELVERVRRVMPPRWFTLLERYYVQEYTLEEIGEELGISRERVRQLIAKAVRRARLHCAGR